MKNGFRAGAAGCLALIVSLAVVWRFRLEPWPPLRIAGTLVGLLGILLLCIARYQLGRSFSVTAQARRLVTTGVYSRVRNPIYVGGELIFVGAAMFLPSWIPLVIVAITIPVQIARARREATVLRAAFGDEYEQYRRSTWF